MVLAKKTLVRLRPGEDCLQEVGVSVTLVRGPAKGTMEQPDRCWGSAVGLAVEGEVAVWPSEELSLRLEELFLQEEVECPMEAQFLQKRGRDS
jgi:hypothetical protein